jgi:cytoskeletal protein CcmA (bactofilin family)
MGVLNNYEFPSAFGLRVSAFSAPFGAADVLSQIDPHLPLGNSLVPDRRIVLLWAGTETNWTQHEPNGQLRMSTQPNPNSKNVLNSDVEVKGMLKFSGELTFDGRLDGDINSDGTLTLGDNAMVKGTIDVSSVVVRGKITGNIIAKDKIELKAKTELFGDVRAAKLVIEEGVTFVGKTEVNPNKVSPTPQPPRGAAETPKGPAPAKGPGI